MNMLFTAGGTGGHMYPALAVARAILDRSPDTAVLFMTGTKDIERKIIGESSFAIKTIPVKGMPRKMSLALAPFCFNLGVSILRSLFIVRSFRPSLILATGGYISAPPVIAGWMLGIPIFMQEQNSYPGITTRALARFSRMVFLGFEEASSHLGKRIKTMVTGNPVRKAIGTVPREKAASVFGLNPDMKTLLVFGGSQGARVLNDALAVIVESLASGGIQVLWQTGAVNYEMWRQFDNGIQGRIRVVPYIDDMSSAYSASDLVVSRAGAMTIAEITVCGLPAIFVPFAGAAENHQEHNARSLQKAGAAVVLTELELTPQKLRNEIVEIIFSEERLKNMAENAKKCGRKEAAQIIAGHLLAFVGMN